MKRVTGIGGIFFKAKDAPALQAWSARTPQIVLDNRATAPYDLGRGPVADDQGGIVGARAALGGARGAPRGRRLLAHAPGG